ncbi:MAG TPA: hypothetical protein VF884_10300 [Nitrososphaeraceae archaeon]
MSERTSFQPVVLISILNPDFGPHEGEIFTSGCSPNAVDWDKHALTNRLIERVEAIIILQKLIL